MMMGRESFLELWRVPDGLLGTKLEGRSSLWLIPARKGAVLEGETVRQGSLLTGQAQDAMQEQSRLGR